jgi:3-methyladenine DNA glycosylase AlkD
MNEEFFLDLRRTYAEVRDPVRALAMRAYQREQFHFAGISAPQRRIANRPLLKALKGAGPDLLLEYARRMWEMDEREYQYTAIDLLDMHWKELSTNDIPAVLELAKIKSWWDSIDGLAGIIGDVLRYTHDGMDSAIKNENMWIRRIAMLHQLGWREHVDEKRLFSYALELSSESEFFIQKAIGWALRDYAWHQAEVVLHFIESEKSRLPALSYREAKRNIKNKASR